MFQKKSIQSGGFNKFQKVAKKGERFVTIARPMIWVRNRLLYRKYKEELLQRRTRPMMVSISNVL
jgi:hypothetical protein